MIFRALSCDGTFAQFLVCFDAGGGLVFHSGPSHLAGDYFVDGTDFGAGLTLDHHENTGISLVHPNLCCSRFPLDSRWDFPLSQASKLYCSGFGNSMCAVDPFSLFHGSHLVCF